MSYAYDENNVFAKILRGEIPCNKVFENEHALAFHDIQPQAETHVLVIPKGPYVNADHFAAAASDAEIAGFWRAVAEVAGSLGLAPAAGGAGYRLVANAGPHARQEVFHFHVHIFGGEPLGPMLSKARDGGGG